MNTDKETYQAYTAILSEELIPALGCTEPVCVAYAADQEAEIQGRKHDHMVVEISRKIIKKLKRAVVNN